MSSTMRELGIDQLSVEDPLALAQEIWESVEKDVERMPLTDLQRLELERRLAESLARPDAVISWERIKAEALAIRRCRKRN